MKKAKFMRSCLAVVMVCSLIFSICGTTVFAAIDDHGVTMGDVNNDGELTYVALGDSMVNGYGLSGYYPNEGLAGAIDKGNKWGYMQVVPESYPALFAEIIDADKFYPLAISGMRAEELRVILDEEYEGDDYTKTVFTAGGSGLNEHRFAQALYGRDTSKANWNTANVTGDVALETIRAEYIAALAAADVISINIGNYNFGEALTDTISGILNDMMGGMLGENFESKYDFSIRALLAEYPEYAAKYDELYDEYYPMVVAQLGAENAASAEKIVNAIAYSVFGFMKNYGESVRLINEINPDAEIIVIGIANIMEGICFDMTVDGEATCFEIDNLFDYVIDNVNVFMAGATAKYYENAYYVAEPKADLIVNAIARGEMNDVVAEKFMTNLAGYFQMLAPMVGGSLGGVTNRVPASYVSAGLSGLVDMSSGLPSIDANADVASLFLPVVINVLFDMRDVEKIEAGVQVYEQYQKWVAWEGEYIASSNEYYKPSFNSTKAHLGGTDATFGECIACAEEHYELVVLAGTPYETKLISICPSALVGAVYVAIEDAIVEAAGDPSIDLDDLTALTANAGNVVSDLMDSFGSVIDFNALMAGVATNGTQAAIDPMYDNMNNIFNGLLTEDVPGISSVLYFFARFLAAEGLGVHPSELGHEQIAEAMCVAIATGSTCKTYASDKITATLEDIYDLAVEYGPDVYEAVRPYLVEYYNENIAPEVTLIQAQLAALNTQYGPVVKAELDALWNALVALDAAVKALGNLASDNVGVALDNIQEALDNVAEALDIVKNAIDEFNDAVDNVQNAVNGFINLVNTINDNVNTLIDNVENAYDNAISGAYVADEDSFYVSLGDSMATGMGLDGYTNYGYMTEVLESYPALLAEYIFGNYAKANNEELFGDRYMQLACGGLRVEDILAILDEDYVGDSYTEESLATLVAKSENAGAAATLDAVRAEYIEYIKNADLITITAGANNFTTFVTSQMVRYAAGQPSHIDWSLYLNAAEVEMIEAAKAEALAAVVAAGVIDPSIIAQAALMIESYLYGYVGFAFNYTETLNAIHAINPDATVVVVGLYNPIDKMTISVGGVELAIGELLDGLVELSNIHFTAYAMLTPNTIFVDVPATETYLDEMIDNGDVTDTSLGNIIENYMYVNSGEAMHANADGHEYIFEEIISALDITPLKVEAVDPEIPGHVHNYTIESDRFYHWMQCACGYFINVDRHDFGYWTTYSDDEHRHVCDICDFKEYDAHDFGAWIVVKEATTETEGLEKKVCKSCGETVTSPIEKIEATTVETTTETTTVETTTAETTTVETTTETTTVETTTVETTTETTTVETTTAETTTVTPVEEESNFLWLWILLGVIAVGGVAAAIYFGLNKKKVA